MADVVRPLTSSCYPFCDNAVDSISPMSHLPYHIFCETLAIKYPDCGHALWKPSPGELYDAVEVGDVGFIRDDYFHRLFNVFLPGDHPSHQRFGVPESHHQLRLKGPNLVYRGSEGSSDFVSRHVSLSRGRDIYAAGPDDDSHVTVSCPGKQGALLSLPLPAQHEDTIATGDFGRWIVKNIDYWFAFAENLGLGINRMQDIILVTGRHRAKSWVNAAFSEGQGSSEISFGIRVSGASSVSIEQRQVRGGARLNLGPNGENLPENQCIFVRGFRVVRILNIFPILRGQAGPAPDIDEHKPGPDKQCQLEPMGTCADADFQDPLHVVLKHIAERAPGCDMALVHDDDLACIANASPGNLQPDTVITYLQDFVPETREIQLECGSLPGDKNGAAVNIAEVAILSVNESLFEATSMLFDVRSLDDEITSNNLGQYLSGFLIFNCIFLAFVVSFLTESYKGPAVPTDVLWFMNFLLSLTSALFMTWVKQQARTLPRLCHALSASDLRRMRRVAMVTITLAILSLLVGLAILFSMRYKRLAIAVSIIVGLIGMGYTSTVLINFRFIHPKRTSLLGT